MIRESGLISNGGKRVGWLAQLVWAKGEMSSRVKIPDLSSGKVKKLPLTTYY
jgi:hypothetical protein